MYMNNATNMTSVERKVLIEQYTKMINKWEYSYFVTVTLKYEFNMERAILNLNKLLHYVNSSYCRSYKRNKKFIKGFVCYEPHLKGNVHFHLIIRKDNFERRDGKSLEEIFKDKSMNVKEQRVTRMPSKCPVYNVFGSTSIVVKEIHSENVVNYIMKKSWGYQCDNISPLTIDGVSFT